MIIKSWERKKNIDKKKNNEEKKVIASSSSSAFFLLESNFSPELQIFAQTLLLDR